MISVKKLMILERLLLEAENRFKFELKLAELIELYDFLKTVGRITNLFFVLQEEYYKKYEDKEKLKEYHNRLLEDTVKVDTIKMCGFIDESCKIFDDEEFKNIVAKNRFWGN